VLDRRCSCCDCGACGACTPLTQQCSCHCGAWGVCRTAEAAAAAAAAALHPQLLHERLLKNSITLRPLKLTAFGCCCCGWDRPARSCLRHMFRGTAVNRLAVITYVSGLRLCQITGAPGVHHPIHTTSKPDRRGLWQGRKRSQEPVSI
jgi:hypothetical protein